MDELSEDDPALAFVGEIHGYLGIREFRAGLLDALMRLVPSEWASLNELGRTTDEVVFVASPVPPAEYGEAFMRLAGQNPLVERFLRTLDGRPYRFSDVVTREQLHALELYREVYAQIRVEHQIAFVVETAPERFLAVALSRHDPDYSDAERALLGRLRPAIIQAHRHAVAQTRLLRGVTREQAQRLLSAALRDAGLTAREADVVSLLAVGHSIASLAQRLEISARTVNKHLQTGYRKLGVTGKSAAAAAAWALAERLDAA
ncbi:LuxR C-terminal-related transcriptional regulator [Conexibacter sp. JD483]|uniref:helix-turn-helix transcriptional regulator n=1 Tax=unclassified Conexibacter TaxID=2627773 RepID=UPI002715E198|nr:MULTISPECIES: LuxR C-terminal-related transcriptional regulator [unclassified Conexibacter]MDO8189363.1 LuxR C-terminal-related transcriptional regulator [Conexibacter sp. CPCC 205706]MDO8197360.1 LuxR C-terminal-related transcriptional regulator [Conexibacter sp. CPCC 205762]MDR9372542.1 LuxR C-terminal-related transcriptional regulator [Conexibacter sp. JD483]